MKLIKLVILLTFVIQCSNKVEKNNNNVLGLLLLANSQTNTSLEGTWQGTKYVLSSTNSSAVTEFQIQGEYTLIYQTSTYTIRINSNINSYQLTVLSGNYTKTDKTITHTVTSSSPNPPSSYQNFKLDYQIEGRTMTQRLVNPNNNTMIQTSTYSKE